MSRSSKKGKRRSAVRRATEIALDIAVGGPALAVDKASESIEKVVGEAEGALRNGRRALRDNARTLAKTARNALREKDGRAYDDRTRDELYELAVEREIEGRSSMRKTELIAALRAER